MERVIRPALAEMARRGTPFRGILFAGLMLTTDGPKLIEFNVRFGDPECQALLLRLMSDLLPALLAACDGEMRISTCAGRGRLDRGGDGGARLSRTRQSAAPRSGPRAGRRRAEACRSFMPAPRRTATGRILAAGGRVLTVCATGADCARRETRPMQRWTRSTGPRVIAAVTLAGGW